VGDVGDCMFVLEANGSFELLVDGGKPSVGGGCEALRGIAQ
jgi:hypothetical protein